MIRVLSSHLESSPGYVEGTFASGKTTGAETSITLSDFVVPSVANPCIVIAGAAVGGRILSGVSFGAETDEEGASATYSLSLVLITATRLLRNPTPGTNDLVCSFSGSGSAYNVVCAAVFSGVADASEEAESGIGGTDTDLPLDGEITTITNGALVVAGMGSNEPSFAGTFVPTEGALLGQQTSDNGDNGIGIYWFLGGSAGAQANHCDVTGDTPGRNALATIALASA